MTKIRIQTSDIGCRKPGCRHRLERTARHHMACETAFINAFRKAGKRKTGTELYRILVKRYHEFRDEDVVVICDWHHCEIHLLYDKIILEDQQQRRRPLRRYTWPQASALMRKLREACLEWMEETTPGVNPEDCAAENRFPQRKERRVRNSG